MNSHPWRQHNMHTGMLRQAAKQLTEQAPAVETASGPSEETRVLLTCVSFLNMAADHIERLERSAQPFMIQLSTMVTHDETGKEVQELYGLDSCGQVWIYAWEDDEEEGAAGWYPMRNGVAQVLQVPEESIIQ